MTHSTTQTETVPGSQKPINNCYKGHRWMGLLRAQTKKNTNHKKLAREECTGEDMHSMPMLWLPDGSKPFSPRNSFQDLPKWLL